MNVYISSMGNMSFGVPVLLKKITDECNARGIDCYYLAVKNGKDIDGDETLYRKLNIQATRIYINEPVGDDFHEYLEYSDDELDDMVRLSYQTDVLLNRVDKKDEYLDDVKLYLENLRLADQRSPIDLFIVWGMRIRERTIQHYARKHNKKIFIFEHGYFRPFTLTVDPSGVNAENSLPRAREFYDKVEFDLERFNKYLNIAETAVYDNRLSSEYREIYGEHKRSISLKYLNIRKLCVKFWLRVKKRRYTDLMEKAYNFPKDKLVQISNFFIERRALRNHNHRITEILEQDKPFIFVPFQLQTDSQIVLNSPYVKTMAELAHLIVETVKQYNKQFNIDYAVIFKLHPMAKSKDRTFSIMDILSICGEVGPGYITASMETQQMIKKSQLIVTVNSTVGVEALAAGKKVVTLGNAFYNIEGIVHHSSSPKGLSETIHNALTVPRDDDLIKKFLYYIRFHYFHEIYYLDPDDSSIKKLVDKLIAETEGASYEYTASTESYVGEL